MNIKIFSALFVALFALSGCQDEIEVQPNLKPVFSEVKTYPEILIKNRPTTYSCDVSNFDIDCALTKTYIQIDDGYPMEYVPKDGKLSITEAFINDTKITFIASYWDYDTERYEYVEQSLDVEFQEPYFKNFILGDELDYVYSESVMLDYMHPEQIGSSLYYVNNISGSSTAKSSDFEFYYFMNNRLIAVGKAEHQDPIEVFSVKGYSNLGCLYAYTGRGFSAGVVDNNTLKSIDAVYADGFTPSDSEAAAVQQIVENCIVYDDESFQIISDLVLGGKVEFYVQVMLNDYPDLWFTEHHATFDYTPEGKVTSEFTLKRISNN